MESQNAHGAEKCPIATNNAFFAVSDFLQKIIWKILQRGRKQEKNMKKEDLVIMTGSEEEADFLVTLLLDSVKLPFVLSVVHGKIKDVENSLDLLKEEGIVYWANGGYSINWAPDNNKDKCYDAQGLLCDLSRLKGLISVKL